MALPLGTRAQIGVLDTPAGRVQAAVNPATGGVERLYISAGPDADYNDDRDLYFESDRPIATAPLYAGGQGGSNWLSRLADVVIPAVAVGLATFGIGSGVAAAAGASAGASVGAGAAADAGAGATSGAVAATESVSWEEALAQGWEGAVADSATQNAALAAMPSAEALQAVAKGAAAVAQAKGLLSYLNPKTGQRIDVAKGAPVPVGFVLMGDAHEKQSGAQPNGGAVPGATSAGDDAMGWVFLAVMVAIGAWMLKGK